MMLETAGDFCSFPLKFEEPIPPVLQSELSRAALANLACVTTADELRKWFKFRNIGANLKGGRSFSAKFLRVANANAAEVLGRWAASYVAVSFDPDEEQPGKMKAELFDLDDEGHLRLKPHAFTFDFLDLHGVLRSGPAIQSGYIQYLIFSEYLRQKDWELATECCPNCKGRGQV